MRPRIDRNPCLVLGGGFVRDWTASAMDCYRPCFGWWCASVSECGFRPYLENYTVDASIFVAKLIRAHGGCLGIRSR